jgi:menaquinol-cytochrome c reductase iron-sulfur subunit
MTSVSKKPPQAAVEPRRGFLIQFVTFIAGAVVALFPVGVGLFAFLDPLRPKTRRGPAGGAADADGYYKVARLDALSDGGVPQYAKIVADRADAWTYIPNEPIGAIYLKRTGDEVVAFNVVCPHAGCAVDFDSRQGAFRCPCHNSSFSPEGARSANSPSPRDLDQLPVKVEDGQVWVQFQNFRTGTAEKVPVA